MKRVASNLVGSVIEAWQEVRIHKTRVMLSLIGVAVAVCAITTVVGLGGVAQQATVESSERSGGRAASLYLSASMNDGSTPTKMPEIWRTALERYKIDYASRVVNTSQTVQFADGAVPVQTFGVDPPYGTMHRITLDEGTWFTDDDRARLAPAVLINSIFWDRLGRPDLRTHPTATLVGERTTTAVVTGVYPALSYETEPAMYILADALTAITPVVSGPNLQFGPPSYELWVPVDVSEQLVGALQRDVQGALGSDAVVQVNRQDYAAFQDGDPYLSLKLTVGAIAGLVLLLGALGLVNIALVTLKQRIREIGIRRSFGATAGRVFFAVMMESVVATVVAGIVGVIAAVLIVKSPLVEDFISQGQVTDFPPFPVEAAILGLVCASVVGALAGLIPALVAVRVKVIDAIRY
ncbi:MAG: ABC transporter permease [Cryobacterium sp.]|uniref:ABC transporter permease n=1 Tax=unclassified Cryobacterium TaxID=2649013 RepID=UPI0018C9F7F8|nr:MULTISPECIES: ABC transporter permease [unclassified Cryobacterium]MCY7403427.1 ABC transporter permease [Cryobacterium sp.]MEC5155562.1 putative ABC transport system permease protein [Cryobacterium sp. CAN_C3]